MRFDKSKAWFDRAVAVTPGGAQTGSKAPGRVGPFGAFPLYAQRAAGPYLTDVDGTTYIDWFNGNCAVTLGHGHSKVTDAVIKAMHRGALPSLPSDLEVEVAERLVSILPVGLDQVRFVKTGSEACAAAVRIARMATGRSVILTVPTGYHGWHDWFTVLRPDHPGVPDWYTAGVATFQYNDLPSVDAALAAAGGDVAAIMLEPTLVEAPAPGFLEGLRERCTRHGILLIFDEMICGARWALGGGSEYFGVTPDLATYGKAFANGLPLAFVAGRADVMSNAWVISGTFGGETVSLAACDAVLTAYRDEEILSLIWTAGRTLMDTMAGAVARLQLPARLAGAACRPVLQWNRDADVEGLTALFQQELARRRVLAHPSGWNPSAALAGASDTQRTVQAVTDALEVVARAYHTDCVRSMLDGELLRPAFARSIA